MANPEHLDLLRRDLDAWNAWRARHPHLRPDLKGADLRRAHLVAADLAGADLRGADLEAALLERANLEGAELNWALFDLDVVDELYVTIAPTLLGGRDAPTLLAGAGWPCWWESQASAEALSLRAGTWI